MPEFIAIVVLIVPMSLLRGFTISTLWGWYVVPTFGAPSLSVVAAIGISLLVGLLTAKAPPKDERGDTEVIYPLVWSLTICGFALLFGWAWTFAL
ncbi:MAG TPA: hypothetical protein VGK17_01450 [Propionicimonas sp.]|jgi:hypothetical protein